MEPTQSTQGPSGNSAESQAPLVMQERSILTATQAKDMATDLLKTHSRETVNAALKADGHPTLEEMASPASTSEAATEIDAAYPPAKPGDYRMPRWGDPSAPLSDKLLQQDATTRSWLSEARFPAEIGSSLAEEVYQVVTKSQSMSEVEREVYAREQLGVLERLWGDRTAMHLSLCTQFIEELEACTPGVKAFMNDSGAGDSAMVIKLVFDQAERLYFRQNKPGEPWELPYGK